MPFSRVRDACWTISLLLGVWSGTAHAAGLGPIAVHSGLGQPLRATVPLFGADGAEQDASCVRAKITSIDGAVSLTPRIGVTRNGGSAFIQISTLQSVNDLALDVRVGIGCDISIQRSYQILIDPAPIQPAAVPPVPAVAGAGSGVPLSEAAAPAGTRRVPGKRRAASPPQARRGEAASENDPPPASGRTAARHARTGKAPRSVLRMSGLDTPTEELLPQPGLRMSERLSGIEEADPQRLAELRRDQARLAAYLRGEDAAQADEDRLQAAQAEIEKLRAEASRAERLRRAERAAAETARAESQGWVRSLQILLAACLLALGWLAWRFYAIKRREAQASWRELLGEHDGATTLSPLAENSGFGTSVFGSFDTSAFPVSDFHTSPPDATPPAKDGLQLVPLAASPEARQTLRGAPLPQEAPPAKASKPSGHRNVTRLAGARPGRGAARSSDPAQEMKAEEISDVMELANVWMAMHDSEKVLELLEPFAGVEQPESPLPWLCLLDVYRSLGNREKYEAILARIKRIYNVRLAPWDAEADAEPPKTLADFPHIIDAVLELWETERIAPYLEGLLKDDREGTRQGLALPAYRDIIRLLALANDASRPRSREDVEREIAEAISAAAQKREAAADATARAAHAAPPAEAPRIAAASPQRSHGARGRASAAALSVSEAGPEETAGVDYDTMSPMAIKLHLAMAYVDIGDKEGALLLLEEVVHGGTPDQVEQAEALLMTLR